METLVKSSTPLRFSRRVDSYEPLDQIVRGDDEDESGRGKDSSGDDEDDDDGSGSRRSVSGKMKSRRRQSPIMAWTSLSFRRERARKRLIFLRGYKLQSSSVRSRTGRLRKVVVRVIRTALVKVVSFVRRCNTTRARSGIRIIGLPARVFRCC